ncbi:hypothetical protein DFJ63DRAFT_334029 [Scheffersomyces coipomensis]|uniref:uncharacterized protein n=1 Tax=Scheffersomyces coipomensis TaxID=1788519 RepID=UPI00315D0CB9
MQRRSDQSRGGGRRGSNSRPSGPPKNSRGGGFSGSGSGSPSQSSWDRDSRPSQQSSSSTSYSSIRSDRGSSLLPQSEMFKPAGGRRDGGGGGGGRSSGRPSGGNRDNGPPRRSGGRDEAPRRSAAPQRDSGSAPGNSGGLKVHPDRLKQVPIGGDRGGDRPPRDNDRRGPPRDNDRRGGGGDRRGGGPPRGGRDNGRDSRIGDKRRADDDRRGGEKRFSDRNGRPRERDSGFKTDRRHDGNQSKVDAFLTDIDSIDKADSVEGLKTRLEKVESFPALEDIKVIDSGWGIKAKGFENVSAQKAKLSGLFPLPGYPRPVDYTKLEGVVTDRLAESDNLLLETSKIDALDSKNAKILVLTNIDFEKINYLKLMDYFNTILKSIDLENTPELKIEKRRFTKDNNNLIIEFTYHLAATIILAYSGLALSFNKFKEDSEPYRDEELTFTINFERPKEYIIQNSPAYEASVADQDIEEIVKDGPRKVTLKVSPNATEASIIQDLKNIAPIKAFQLLREKGTKESIGIAFIEFYIDPTVEKTNEIITSEIQEYINKVKAVEIIEDAFFSCIIPNETSIQDCVVEMDTLKKLVSNEYVRATPKSRVIQLLNLFNPRDLADDAKFQFFKQDIYQEVIRFGDVKSMKIPRPASDFTPGLSQFREPGFGKVFVEFDDETIALQAIIQLAGRSYNDRIVLAGYFSYEDYQKGLL